MVQRVWDGLSSVEGWDMNVLFPVERTVTGFVGECYIRRIEGSYWLKLDRGP